MSYIYWYWWVECATVEGVVSRKVGNSGVLEVLAGICVVFGVLALKGLEWPAQVL
jgi:hypothetical protein